MTDALPSASTLAPPQSHLHSSFHQPHSRHTSSSTTALHHRPNSHRSTLQTRFGGVGTLAEEDPSASSSSSAAQLRAEKARMYDRAFQQSTMLSSSSAAPDAGGSGGGARGGSRLNPQSYRPQQQQQEQQQQRPLEPPIDASSALDGDSFVAPTESMPFGLPASDDEEEGHDGGGGVREGGEESVERMRSQGLRGIAQELYRR